jgi:hypothetical protein
LSDRIPGTSHDNPIWHRGYRIYISDGHAPGGYAYQFVHDDYDPTPVHLYDGPSDHRCGFGRSVAECKAEIDAMEAEAAR